MDIKYEVGDKVLIPIKSTEFGRIATGRAKSVILQKIREEERKAIYNDYYSKEREVISGVVQRYVGKNMTVNLGRCDAMLPEAEQVKSEQLKPTDRIKVYVVEVKENPKGPKITVSRNHQELVRKLFESEVSEIKDGIVEIKSIAREAGSRTKIAVCSHEPDIDPVGACVGVRGARIHGIVRELGNENIDVIPFTNNVSLLITRALAPARVSSVVLNEEEKRADVYLANEEVSKAIGKSGYNIRLASQLSGYEIDVYREGVNEEDIELSEFNDEIEEWVIEQLRNAGLDTAKSVLELSAQELMQRTDLEEETVNEVLRVLAAEFE